METFPAVTVHYGSSPEPVTPRVQRFEFGDGYTQRIGLGLNQIRENWDVIFKDISAAEKDAIVVFLKAMAGAEAFYWTPIGESVPRKYTCPEWLPVPQEGGLWTVTAKFIEEFDL
ncbi:MAG: phage tail protein [Thermodesulfobacteriota bacterium]